MANPCVLCSITAKGKDPGTAWVPVDKARAGRTVTVNRSKWTIAAVYPGATADLADVKAISRVVPVGE